MYSALIIDDDDTVQAYLKRILTSKFGFIVYQASNGIDGIKALQDNKPDVILLDYSMPQMNGVEFLQTIQKQDKLKDIPVLIISSSNETHIIREMIGLGVVDYLLKPIDPELTFQRIQKAIDKLKK